MFHFGKVKQKLLTAKIAKNCRQVREENPGIGKKTIQHLIKRFEL